MKKKVIGIFIVSFLIFPIISGFGKSSDIQSQDIENIGKNDFTEDIISMINQVDENIISSYLEDFVSFGNKKTGSENCRMTAEYIYDKFLDFGLNTYFDDWRYPRYKVRQKVLLVDRNVIGIHNGDDINSDAIIIVCAHYDTIGDSPGANDDGSGIAAMLLIAEIISKYNFNHTIKFIAFSGEEQGCFGSFYDAKQAYRRDENIIAVLNIDSIGFVNTSKDGKIVHIRSPERSRWIIDYANEISDKFDSYIDLKAKYTLQSICDHKCYNDYGYDAVHFVQPKMELYKWMHTPNDTIDKINFTYLTKVTKFILAVTAEFAYDTIDIQIRITKPFEGQFYLYNIPILKTPDFNLFLTKMRGLTYIIGKTKATVKINTNDEISSVYFGIDGYRNYVCNEPPFEWKIGNDRFPLPYGLKGYHRITVCAITKSGDTAYDEMDIFIIKLL